MKPERPREKTPDPGATRSSGPDRALVGILLVGAAARVLLLLWFWGEPPRAGDELEYHELGANLAERGEMVLHGVPCTMRPPLYPLFVAGIYAVFGVGNYQAVRAGQAVVGLFTSLLVYFLGRELYDRRVGRWAAGLTSFYPPLLGHACLLYSETLFALWVVLLALSVVWALRTERVAPWAAPAVFLGAASLTRSILWLFPPVLGLFVLLAWRAALWRRLAATGLIFAVFTATIAPWSIRCSRLEDTLVTIDVMGGRNLMMGNYEHTPTFRAWDAISVGGEKAWYRVLKRKHPEFPTLTQGQRDKLALRYGLRYMLEHPAQTAARSTVKFFNFWQLERTLVAGLQRGWYGDPPTPIKLVLAAIIFGSYAAAMFAAVFGAVMCPPRDRRLLVFVLLLLAYVCGLHALVFAHSRYHLPLAPLELVLVAAAVVHGRSIRRRIGGPAFLLAVALCGVLLAGWVWEIALVDYPRFLEIFRA